MNKYKIVTSLVYTARKDKRNYSKSQTYPNHPYHKQQNTQKNLFTQFTFIKLTVTRCRRCQKYKWVQKPIR